MSSESAASTGSQANFARPEETLIIFDWDDTLCPSYWVKQVRRPVHSSRLHGAKRESHRFWVCGPSESHYHMALQ